MLADDERLSRQVLATIPPTAEIKSALGEALNEVSALRKLLKMARDRDLAEERGRDRQQAGRATR